jgi:glutamate/tyrosine decarboxylase-like PLP-dependent enzyme
LKVWLAIQQVGRSGYEQTIADDIRLARLLFERVSTYNELEALTQSLSIATFRFVPNDLRQTTEPVESYLEQLNRELLTRLQNSGEAYVSNAVVHGKFALRACIVNFRTAPADIEALPPLVVRIGIEVDRALRPQALPALNS